MSSSSGGKKLTFIEEIELKGFLYRPNGILGNGFYGNGVFITLSDMEKISKSSLYLTSLVSKDMILVNTDKFVEYENLELFYTNHVLELFSGAKKHQLHNLFNKHKEAFQSQKLFTIKNRKRIFSKDAIKFIYDKLIKKEVTHIKKRGRKPIRYMTEQR